MCVNPIILKNKLLGNGKNALTTPVPCGKCPDCKKAKFNAWLFRLTVEQKRSVNPLFVTLTYDSNSVPLCKKGQQTLNKRDLQLFMKRLRKEHSKKNKTKLVYYAVGEYGTRTNRPHYHLILLNLLDISLIQKTWQKGFDYTKPLLSGGIQYVLKYIQKNGKISKSDSRQKEFSIMSKGIGTNYLTDNMVNYHLSNVGNCYVTLAGGSKLPIPKYFKEKIYPQSFRDDVTSYLKLRAEEMEIKRLRAVSRQYPAFSREACMTYLEKSKQNVKFEVRLKEVL